MNQQKVIETSEKCPQCEDPMEEQEKIFYCNECQVSVQKPYEAIEIAEFMEHTHGAIASILEILKKFKTDHYESQDSKDELDELIQEVDDSLECLAEGF